MPPPSCAAVGRHRNRLFGAHICPSETTGRRPQVAGQESRRASATPPTRSEPDGSEQACAVNYRRTNAGAVLPDPVERPDSHSRGFALRGKARNLAQSERAETNLPTSRRRVLVAGFEVYPHFERAGEPTGSGTAIPSDGPARAAAAPGAAFGREEQHVGQRGAGPLVAWLHSTAPDDRRPPHRRALGSGRTDALRHRRGVPDVAAGALGPCGARCATSPSGTGTAPKRRIGLVACLALSVGTVAGGWGFAVSGIVVDEPGPASVLAGIVMPFSALCSAAIASRFKAGDSRPRPGRRGPRTDRVRLLEKGAV